MAVAWTTLAIVFALLPGVSFFFGASLKERFARELIRTSVVGDIAAAIFAALIAHGLAWIALYWLFGFRIERYALIIANLTPDTSLVSIPIIVRFFEYVFAYGFLIAVASFLLGLLAAKCGFIELFSAFKWVNRISSRKTTIITVYVATNTVINNQCLMYKGILVEYFLNPNGYFSYVVMTNCSKYLMSFDNGKLSTGEQLSLFRGRDLDADKSPNFFVISGDKIANILFDRNDTHIAASKKGQERLEEALNKQSKNSSPNETPRPLLSKSSLELDPS